MAGGTVTLGLVARRTTMLDVACGICPRRGRLSVKRLLAQHGAAMPMPSLLRVLAADCPHLDAQQAHERCGARFPALAGMFIANR